MRSSASRSINKGSSNSPVRSSPRLWHPDGAGALGLEPRASPPAITRSARRGGDRPSSTSLKHALRHRHRPSLQSCVFTQCVRPRVARDQAELWETGARSCWLSDAARAIASTGTTGSAANQPSRPQRRRPLPSRGSTTPSRRRSGRCARGSSKSRGPRRYGAGVGSCAPGLIRCSCDWWFGVS
jgi:hypothetical protein